MRRAAPAQRRVARSAAIQQKARPVPVAGFLPPARDGWTRQRDVAQRARPPALATQGEGAPHAAALAACAKRACARSVGGARSAGLPGAIKYDGALDCLRKTLRASAVRFRHESATGF